MEFNIINFETEIEGSNCSTLLKYENYLIIKTIEELVIYSSFKNNKTYKNVLKMRKLYDKYNNRSLENFIQHFATDGYAGMAFREGALKNIDMADAVDEIMSDINQLQLQKITEGNVILINSKGGYFWKPEKDLKILKKLCLSNEQILDWFDSKQKLLDCVLYDLENTPITRTSIAFIQDKNGKIYHNKIIYNHDAICKYYGIDCDKVIKYDYNPRYKNTKCELGIEGLSYSIVYETVELPFEPTNYHCKELEKFIKKFN